MFKNRITSFNCLIDNNTLNKSIKDAINTICNQGMILVGGSGGSAADSSHFVGELLGRYTGKLTPFPAINMMSELATLTAMSNDVSYDSVLLQYIYAFNRYDPAYLFISTSGTSKNITNAITLLKELKLGRRVVLLTGDTVKDDLINVINLPSHKTEFIQEFGLMVLHEIATGIKKSI